jgi:hypothetical protein
MVSLLAYYVAAYHLVKGESKNQCTLRELMNHMTLDPDFVLLGYTSPYTLKCTFVSMVCA